MPGPGYNKIYDDKSENPLNAESLINTNNVYMEDFMPIKKNSLCNGVSGRVA